MQPQGSGPINETYFDNQADAFSNITVCSELQVSVNQVWASLTAMQTALNQQVASLAPLLALTTPPTNLAQVVTWLGTFISGFLTPMLTASTTAQAQLALLTTQVAKLTTAVNEAASKIPGCSITYPPL